MVTVSALTATDVERHFYCLRRRNVFGHVHIALIKSTNAEPNSPPRRTTRLKRNTSRKCLAATAAHAGDTSNRVSEDHIGVVQVVRLGRFWA